MKVYKFIELIGSDNGNIFILSNIAENDTVTFDSSEKLYDYIFDNNFEEAEVINVNLNKNCLCIVIDSKKIGGPDLDEVVEIIGSHPDGHDAFRVMFLDDTFKKSFVTYIAEDQEDIIFDLCSKHEHLQVRAIDIDDDGIARIVCVLKGNEYTEVKEKLIKILEVY